MKKLIPLSLLIVVLFLQSCRQGDEIEVENQKASSKMTESARRSDTLRIEKIGPPVKDGQDWIY